MRRYTCYVSFIILLLCGLMFLFSSCERDEEQGSTDFGTLQGGVPVTVAFTIGGMTYDDYMVEVRQGQAPLYLPEETSSNPLQRGTESASEGTGRGIGSAIVPLTDDLYMYATLTKDEVPVMLRAISALNVNSNVRIVAYTIPGVKVDYADYTTSSGYAVGPQGAPLIIPSGTYRFVAYSYNNSSPLDSYTLYPDTTAYITSLDLLWGDTTATVGTSSPAVHIRTHHKFSQVKVVATVDHNSFGVGSNTIDDIAASVSHIPSRLVVKTGALHFDNTTPVKVPFTWRSSGGAPSWESYPKQIFMNGNQNPGVTVAIDNVRINGTLYSAGYTVNYNSTMLEPGKEYTLNVRFTK